MRNRLDPFHTAHPYLWEQQHPYLPLHVVYGCSASCFASSFGCHCEWSSSCFHFVIYLLVQTQQYLQVVFGDLNHACACTKYYFVVGLRVRHSHCQKLISNLADFIKCPIYGMKSKLGVRANTRNPIVQVLQDKWFYCWLMLISTISITCQIFASHSGIYNHRVYTDAQGFIESRVYWLN